MRDTALSISTRTGTITSDLAPRDKAVIGTVSMRNSRQTLGLYASPAYLKRRGTPSQPSELPQRDALHGVSRGGEPMPWTLQRGEKGLVTHYLLFVINLADRPVHVAGITTNPTETWMLQVGRNMTDAIDGALLGKRYLILDRDTKYSAAFRKMIGESGTAVIRLPPRSPNLNAFAERFVRSIKEECLNRMIFVGQASLRHAVGEYVTHYRGERNHQGLGNRLLVVPIKRIGGQNGSIRKIERLGGMLNYYERCRVKRVSIELSDTTMYPPGSPFPARLRPPGRACGGGRAETGRTGG